MQGILSVYGETSITKPEMSRRIFLRQLGKELAETSKRILFNPSTTTFLPGLKVRYSLCEYQNILNVHLHCSMWYVIRRIKYIFVFHISKYI